MSTAWGVRMPNNLQIATQYLARWYSGYLLHLQLAFLRRLRMVCFERDLQRSSSAIFLQPAGTSSTRPGCTHFQLAWLWMGHPPALWVLSTVYSFLFAFFSNLETSGNVVLNNSVWAQNTLWQKAYSYSTLFEAIRGCRLCRSLKRTAPLCLVHSQTQKEHSALREAFIKTGCFHHFIVVLLFVYLGVWVGVYPQCWRETEQYRTGAHCPTLMSEEVERKDCAHSFSCEVSRLGCINQLHLTCT